MGRREYAHREQIVERVRPGDHRLVMVGSQLVEQQYTWGRWTTMINHFASTPPKESK